MPTKRTYVLTIAATVVLALLFKAVYPEVSLGDVSTVLVLGGLVLAFGFGYVIDWLWRVFVERRHDSKL